MNTDNKIFEGDDKYEKSYIIFNYFTHAYNKL